MITIKSYTSLEQSKKLAEILPLESADMSWDKEFDSGRWLISLVKYTSWIVPRYSYNKIEDRILPCWSLAALFSMLPKSAYLEKGSSTELCRLSLPVELISSDWNLEPIDACYEMIIKLHELDLL